MSRSSSGPQALADAIRSGVAAAAAQDAPGLEDGIRRLAAADPERVRLLLGHVVRSLVEELHPDGLDVDDVQALLRTSYGDAAWCDGVSPAALLAVLAGALGVHPEDPDGDRSDDAPARQDPESVTRHALLLVASLLRRRRGPDGSVPPVAAYVNAALDELKRAETIELP